MRRYYYSSIIKGFYGVCVDKGFKDGFLNKCREDELPLRKLRNTSNDKLYFYVPCKFFEDVRENALSSGAQISLTGVFGLLPIAKKYKNRAFLLSGVILAVLFLALMSLRVWNIKVSGNDKVFTSEILSACEELGLKCGVRKSSIDVEDFQYSLLEKMGDKLIWVSLNIEGMCAELEVREVIKVTDDILGKPCNYIADFDGVIKIYRVYSGTPAVMRGSGVHKGDLLISGVTEYETGESSFTEARGKITALHTVKINQAQTESLTVRKYTETKKRYSISLFGFEIRPFSTELKNAEVTKTTKSLEINNTLLPFYIGEYCFSFFEEEATDDENILRQMALADYLSKVRESFKNSRITSLKEKYHRGFNGEFEAIDHMGKKSVIMLEN